jgi:hypothetical protein
MNLASHATPAPKGNVELLVKRKEAKLVSLCESSQQGITYCRAI